MTSQTCRQYLGKQEQSNKLPAFEETYLRVFSTVVDPITQKCEIGVHCININIADTIHVNTPICTYSRNYSH